MKYIRHASKKLQRDRNWYKRVTVPIVRKRDKDRCLVCNMPAYTIHHAMGRRGKWLNDWRYCGCICFEHHQDNARTRSFNESFIATIKERNPEYVYEENPNGR